MMSTLILVVLLCLGHRARAQFGASIEDFVADERFKNVGQAYVDTFSIVDSNLNLAIVVEDTVGENEFWVVDFQEYNKNTSRLPIDGDTGDIIPSNTGSCSNVIEQGTFDQDVFSDGYHFTDVGNFKERNLTRSQQLAPGSKHLFTSYSRGVEYDDVDIRGLPVRRQDYTMSFKGNFGFFFNCTNTDNQNIWTFSNTTSTVEFRTTIYFTNVRPVDNADGTSGISFVSSSTELIYRLNRIAILNFIISSVALVKPVLDYVIIEPYIVAGQPVPGRAQIEIRFHTVVQSTDGEALSYIANSLNYTSRDEQIEMESIMEGSSGVVKCTFENGGSLECKQEWYFILILDIEDDIIQDDIPVDATGTFTFNYEQHRCTSVVTEPPSGCVSVGYEPFFISMEITIQTVVTVVDTETDEPSIVLLSLTGEDGEDLRGGADAGRRGVNHLEVVSMQVQYNPEFLWSDYDLALMLFMVCRNDQTGNEGGCLDADISNRYVAYYHDDFEYSYQVEGSNITFYNSSSVSDEWDPNGNDTTQQMLDSYSYDTGTSIYSIEFTNTALSQERLEYTITTVYRLEEKASRRRRAIEGPQEDTQADQTEIVRYNPHGRYRRDIISTVALPQGHVVMLESNGCPKESIYESRNCHCTDSNKYYSTETYQCEPYDVYSVDENEDINLADIGNDNGESSDASTIAFPFIFFAVCLLLNFF